jgi:hypothetical protein
VALVIAKEQLINCGLEDDISQAEKSIEKDQSHNEYQLICEVEKEDELEKEDEIKNHDEIEKVPVSQSFTYTYY